LAVALFKIASGLQITHF